MLGDRHMSESLFLNQLKANFRDEQILRGDAVVRAYECDAYTVDKSRPLAVLLPESTEEVQLAVNLCNQFQIPFTPRGAGTGLSGGAMPACGGLIISTKKLTKILEIDIQNRCLHAQTGVVNTKITEAVREFGYHFAPDPSSQSVCTLGGNISENSGGPHTLKYGVTAQHILQLTYVDSQGNCCHLGSRVAESPSLNPLSVMIGAEGTLGVVTEAWVKLTPIPEAVHTALASFATIRAATEAVSKIIGEGVLPAALEMMDRNIMEAVRSAFGLEFPVNAQALLLVECDGSREVSQNEIQLVEGICEAGGALDFQTASSEVERQKLWQARKKGIGAMGRLAPTILTHDGVIPRSKLPEVLEFVYKVAQDAGVGVANLFHAGDGNLHPCFYFDDREPGVIEKVVEAGERILSKCLELGGSVSGEHGIGVEKSAIWAKNLSPNSLRMQFAIREVFEVSDLCNPCKVIPDQKGCIEHVRRWRGAAT